MVIFQKGIQRNGNGVMEDQNYSILYGIYYYFYCFKF